MPHATLPYLVATHSWGQMNSNALLIHRHSRQRHQVFPTAQSSHWSPGSVNRLQRICATFTPQTTLHTSRFHLAMLTKERPVWSKISIAAIQRVVNRISFSIANSCVNPRCFDGSSNAFCISTRNNYCIVVQAFPVFSSFLRTLAWDCAKRQTARITRDV